MEQSGLYIFKENRLLYNSVDMLKWPLDKGPLRTGKKTKGLLGMFSSDGNHPSKWELWDYMSEISKHPNEVHSHLEACDACNEFVKTTQEMMRRERAFFMQVLISKRCKEEKNRGKDGEPKL